MTNHSPRFTSAVQGVQCSACGQALTLLEGMVWATREDYGADCPTALATGGWWRLEVSDETYLDDDDRAHIGELIASGFTSGQIVHTPTGDANRLTIVPIRPERNT
jgi:hypothetical protein